MLGEPIFVLSTGRTGSTLLMRLMNCVQDVYLFGEHNGAFRNLRHLQSMIAHHAADQHRNGLFILEKNGYQESFVAWASPFSQTDVTSHLRDFLINIYTANISDSDRKAVRWGFKEIIYDQEDILFFERLFPEAHFIFMRRNLETQFKSWFTSFRAKRPLTGADIIDYIHKYLIFAGTTRTFLEFDAARFTQVSYEDLQGDGEFEMRRLLKFVNVRAGGPDFERIRQVCAARVDYVPDEAKVEDEAVTHAFSLFRDVMKDLQAKARGDARGVLQASLERLEERAGLEKR